MKRGKIGFPIPRTSVTVRLAELEYQIRNDLGGMLGQEGPGTVNLLRGS